MRPFRPLALSFALTALAASGCGTDPGPPNVILISLDTLRADHLGCYGYELDTSPWLDDLAGRATLFESSWATSPWTLPSHASMFTGLHPFEHGARTYEPVVAADNSLHERVGRLPPGAETLAEFLSERGYQTAGIVANKVYLDARYAVDQGFQSWQIAPGRGDEINARAGEWLAGRDESRPFLLFLNYLDTHRPYNVRPRPDERLPALPPEPPAELLDELYAAVMPATGPVPTELVEKIVRQYDVAVANLDDALRELEGILEERGLWDDTLIVITSDHGEFFGEKHLVEHSKDVYEPALRVPLIVKAPGQERGRVDERPVSNVDIPWIVLDELPDELRRDARDVFPHEPGRHPLIAENYFSRNKDLAASWGGRFRRIRTVLYFDRYKFIRSSDGRSELYDLVADPAENQNLVRERPELVSQVSASLAEYQKAHRRAPDGATAVELDEEMLQQMRDLGYFGDD